MSLKRGDIVRVTSYPDTPGLPSPVGQVGRVTYVSACEHVTDDQERWSKLIHVQLDIKSGDPEDEYLWFFYSDELEKVEE